MSASAACSPDDPKPIRGWLNSFYRTYKGKRLGPYFVRRWKVGRKLHKEYIKPQDVERVKAECAAHREKQNSRREHNRQLNVFMDNWNFLGKMHFRYEEGKPVTFPQVEYVHRLKKEGMYITGRPPSRRRITRSFAKIAGERMIVKTVFELDGTTKVFMVPLFYNHPMDRIKRALMKVWNDVHGTLDPPNLPSGPRNRWLPRYVTDY